MTRFKKVLALLISLSLVLTVVLTGCGAPEVQKPADSQVATSQAASTQAEPQAVQLEPVKLSWYMLFPPMTDQDAVFAEANKYLKEKINAEMDFRTLDWGSYSQKVQTAAASGEEFDILWISDWQEGVKYDEYALKGAIIPLDELITKYAPGTQKFLDQKFWDQMKVDGKIFGVPCYQIFCRATGMWLRKDLVEKYAFDYKNVKNVKDFDPFFDAILKGEPDIIPIASQGNSIMSFGFNSSMAVNGGIPDKKGLGDTGMQVWATDLTKAFWEYEEPTTKEFFLATMKVARDWYLKGYVRKDLLSIQDLSSEIKSGKYATGFDVMKPGAEGEFKDKYGFDVVFLQTTKPELSGVKATELAISGTSKNPERSMMFIELMNTDKYLFNLLANGIEGKHYLKVNENRIARVENNGYQPGMDWALGNTTLGYVIPGKPDDVHQQTMDMNNQATLPLMPDFVFNPENVKNENAVASAIWKEMGQPLWSGVLDPDTNFEKYIQRQKDAGALKVLAEAQKQLDEYWKTHK